MAAVPVAIPVILPATTVAIPPLAALHVPPVGIATSVIVAPTHSAVGPIMVGNGFTVTVVVREQPDNEPVELMV